MYSGWCCICHTIASQRLRHDCLGHAVCHDGDGVSPPLVYVRSDLCRYLVHCSAWASVRLAAMATVSFVMGAACNICAFITTISHRLCYIVALTDVPCNFLFFASLSCVRVSSIARHAWCSARDGGDTSVAAAALLLVLWNRLANYLLQGATKKSFDMLFTWPGRTHICRCACACTLSHGM